MKRTIGKQLGGNHSFKSLFLQIILFKLLKEARDSLEMQAWHTLPVLCAPELQGSHQVQEESSTLHPEAAMVE